MIIIDRIYGKYKIENPLLIDLINSAPVQRLKNIAQYGIPDKYYHLTNYYRFEHSLGVMILLKRLGAGIEEQAAGLLHDVSHTAFSHLIDWVVGDGTKENYQDDQHEKFFTNSVLPGIIKKHGFDPQKISNYKNFTLLEQEIPALCADRVDYSLREFSPELVKQILPALSAHKGKIIFTDKKPASLFAYSFLEKQESHWGGFEAVTRYKYFSKLLKIALTEKIISEKDFWQTDAVIIAKLEKSNNSKIHEFLKALSNKSLEDFPLSGKMFHKKFRHTDPHALISGKLKKLSAIDKNFSKFLSAAKKKNKEGIQIPILP